MNEPDKQTFVRCLRAIMDVYGRKELSEDAWRLWWASLSDYSIGQVRAALESHVNESPYFPKPADVIARCKPEPIPPYHRLVKPEREAITEEQRQKNLERLEAIKKDVFKTVPGGDQK